MSVKQHRVSLLCVLFALLFVAIGVPLCLGAAISLKEITNAEGNDIIIYSSDIETPCVIVLPVGADDSERSAADVLTEYLTAVTQVDALQVDVDSVDLASGGRIVLRRTSGDSAVGSYVIRAGRNADDTASDDKNVYIEADDNRGLFNGAYEFLRRFCGVNIYSADVVTTPRTSLVAIPDGFFLRYSPALEYADTDWISPHNAEFAVANGLNGTYSPIDAVRGGKVKYILFCHSLATEIVPRRELFATHPEYYALNEKGERVSTQLCLSNPAVVERAKQDVCRLVDENYDPDAALNIISVTQDDNQIYCRCSACSAIADTYGGQSGLMLWFVNQIADAVLASTHPDVVVDTFAYQYTRTPPKGISPRPNVCVRLCSIECCFAHALEDPDCAENVAFMSDLRQWSQLCNRLYIWDYVTNYSQTLGIFPDFGVLRANVATFVRYNVVGIYEEGNYYAGSCNTEFADLRAYLLARYMYDPDALFGDDESVMNGFLNAYYGEGGDEIAQFIAYITEHAGDNEGHLKIYSSMAKTLHSVTAADVSRMNALWDAAEQQTADAGNTQALERIRRSRLSWRYYMAVCELGEYRKNLNIARWTSANEELIEDLRAYGAIRYNEGRVMSDNYLYPMMNPAEWDSLTLTVLYSTMIGILGIILIQAIVFAVLAIVRRRPVLLAMPLLTIVVLLLCYCARMVFVGWMSSIVPYVLLTILLSLCVGLYVPMSDYCLRGFVLPTPKKAILQWLIGSAIIAIPTVLTQVIIQVVYTYSCPAMPSCLIAYLWYAIVMITATFIAQNKLFAPKSEDKQTAETAPTSKE